MLDENGVKELRQKKRSAATGVSYKGRARKAAKLQAEIDAATESNFYHVI